MSPPKAEKKGPFAHVAYDVMQKKVGCALIQALMGGFTETGHNVSEFFDNSTWILAPTKDMRVYSVESKEMLEDIIKKTHKANKVTRGSLPVR